MPPIPPLSQTLMHLCSPFCSVVFPAFPKLHWTVLPDQLPHSAEHFHLQKCSRLKRASSFVIPQRSSLCLACLTDAAHCLVFLGLVLRGLEGGGLICPKARWGLWVVLEGRMSHLSQLAFLQPCWSWLSKRCIPSLFTAVHCVTSCLYAGLYKADPSTTAYSLLWEQTWGDGLFTVPAEFGFHPKSEPLCFEEPGSGTAFNLSREW